MKLLRSYLLVALSLISMSPLAASAFTEPDGWGKIKFRSEFEVVKKAYPKIVTQNRTEAQPISPGSTFKLPEIHEAFLEGQKVGSISKCNLRFRFFANRLVTIEFYCGDKAKAEAYLLKTFGEPSSKDTNFWTWAGTKASITFAPAMAMFSYTDNQANDAMQTQLLMFYLGQAAHQTPSPAATAAAPEATPAP